MTLLEVSGLAKTYATGVRALDGVSFTVERGTTVGIVGESGCGKSTLARSILRLVRPDAGTVRLDGEDYLALSGRKLRRAQARVQLVPQNPHSSLNPRMTAAESIEFNLRTHGMPRRDRTSRIAEMLDAVGLTSAQGRRRPHELSGGQMQRVAIARALATRPELVIMDEAVSALDKSVQAQVLNLVADLQRELGVSYVFISHDLPVVEHIADRVLVMYLGRVVESGSAAALWHTPKHPYTKALLAAVPSAQRRRTVLAGEPPSARRGAPGCGFRPRCPVAVDACAHQDPRLTLVDVDQHAACLLVPSPAPMVRSA